MPQPARISIVRGPDKGHVFNVDEELVHLGRGGDNQIALSDESLDDHQASIIRRNGRYAIFTPIEEGVIVDGNAIPAEQWVWLPESSQIRFGATMVQFRYQADESPGANGDANAAPPERPKKPLRKKPAKAGAKGRKVARFITDTSGDHLVRLGEDGKLPDLALAEGNRPAKVDRGKRERSPLLLYAAVGGSLLLSLALLLIDTGNSGPTANDRERALHEIAKFYGKDSEPEYYQRLLREARQARSRGDAKAERKAYQGVLDLLNAEDIRNPDNHTGLTGDRKGDDKLRKLIGILMDRRE